MLRDNQKYLRHCLPETPQNPSSLTLLGEETCSSSLPPAHGPSHPPHHLITIPQTLPRSLHSLQRQASPPPQTSPLDPPVHTAGPNLLNGGIWGTFLADFETQVCLLRHRSQLPPFLLKLCVIVLHTHSYHPPKFWPNPKHHNGSPIFAHFMRACCCLLLLLLLLLLATCQTH